MNAFTFERVFRATDAASAVAAHLLGGRTTTDDTPMDLGLDDNDTSSSQRCTTSPSPRCRTLPSP